jgi:hypothetical protein
VCSDTCLEGIDIRFLKTFKDVLDFVGGKFNEVYERNNNNNFSSSGPSIFSETPYMPPFQPQPNGGEEVFIPSSLPPPLGKDENLIEIASLPKWVQIMFNPALKKEDFHSVSSSSSSSSSPSSSAMTHLNRIQSKVFNTAFNTNENMLICAPTGAGKTGFYYFNTLVLLYCFLYYF